MKNLLVNSERLLQGTKTNFKRPKHTKRKVKMIEEVLSTPQNRRMEIHKWLQVWLASNQIVSCKEGFLMVAEAQTVDILRFRQTDT